MAILFGDRGLYMEKIMTSVRTIPAQDRILGR